MFFIDASQIDVQFTAINDENTNLQNGKDCSFEEITQRASSQINASMYKVFKNYDLICK